ncbi:MAG: CDP-diacylglycerol--glycerol-3-phosphate 3-phosphatidyltransferase [Gammaproteobacteria bacterium]|nr:CDP-diacylglycerol--glycerol-3-phosphate 3-phosphatidyltransferase [Gammaproteobacteria bacterium]
MQMNLPNLLTLLRLALIPVFVLFFYLPFSWVNVACTAVFSLAAVTDLLDGYLARRLGQTSAFGAFLDPVADKLMVGVVLVLLVAEHPTPFMAIPAAVIIGREITVSGLREWMAGFGERTTVAVSVVGKIKTTLQMIAMILLIYREPIGPLDVWTVGMVLLYVAVILTLWSMGAYLRSAWPALVGKGPQDKASRLDKE